MFRWSREGCASEPAGIPPKFDTSALSSSLSGGVWRAKYRLIVCRPRLTVGALSGNENMVGPDEVALTLAFNRPYRALA